MPKKYVPYFPNTIEGQAILDNFTRSRRVLHYRDNTRVYDRIRRGLPLYEVEKIEEVKFPSPQAGEGQGGGEGATASAAASSPTPQPPPVKGGGENLLIRGECLSACAYLKDQGITVDLVYIDPPFASGADYAKKVYLRRNPLLAEKIKKAEEAMDLDELRAFEEKMYGDIWNKEDYLNWMYENLMAIKSVMSENASIYVHLDWHIGHYVKVLMDEVFGEDNFRNNIIWAYFGFKRKTANKYPQKHDDIFFYVKNEDNYVWNHQYRPHSEEYIARFKADKDGRLYRDDVNPTGGGTRVIYLDPNGDLIESFWNDIPPVNPVANERADYATQKPEALLERIIHSSSDKEMVVVDFFGGSGVTAAVANRLGRRFIHVDVGINSIQTTRDRLVAAKADFDLLEIKDGVSLFRNPVQTMDKLKSLIAGLRNEDALDSFWEGAIADSKLGMVPVYVPNLLDHSTRVLDIPLMNRILNEAMPELPDETKQVIVYYIDIDDEAAVKAFIDDNNPTETTVELRDMKELLSEVVAEDVAEFTVEQTKTDWIINFASFSSDRLSQKIDEYNQKRMLNSTKKTLLEDEENETSPHPDPLPEGEGKMPKTKKKIKPIVISDNGLELIELISLDCTNAEGIWSSDYEIKIDKNGYVIRNGEKTKTFWDAKVTCQSQPLRVKIRNIAGDETIFNAEPPLPPE